MAVRTIKVIMNGVSGRMGYRQHLVRSILAIRDQGGVVLADDRVTVKPILVGRSEAKLAELAELHGIEDYTTDLDAAARRPALRDLRRLPGHHERTGAPGGDRRRQAHLHREAHRRDRRGGPELANAAEQAGVKTGVVHDKLYLPGLQKLKRLIDFGFFGRILSVRGEFGYWVFEGDWQPAQRPSWNYRVEDGGGIIVDMFPHWNYVLENLFGKVETVYAQAATHIPDPLGRERRALRGHRRRRRVRHLRARGRHHRADQLVLDRAGQPRRAGRVPRRRHARLGRRRAVRLRRSSTATQPPSRSGTPTWPTTTTSTPTGPRCPTTTCSRTASASSGRSSSATSSRPPHEFDLLSGARGVLLAEVGLQSSARAASVAIPELAL